MKQQQIVHRPAIWLLLAATSLPATPLLAQDSTIAQPPPTDVVVPPVSIPEPVVTTPPPMQPVTRPIPTTPPAAVRTPAPTTRAPVAAERRTTTRTTRTATTRAAPPVRTAAPTAAAPAAPAAAPVAAPAPIAAEPAPAAVPVAAAPAAAPEATGNGSPAIWTWLILGGLALLAGFALFQMRRHRRRVAEEVVYDEEAPVMVFEEPTPVTAAPIARGAAFEERRDLVNADATLATAALHQQPTGEEPVAVVDDVAVGEADSADVAALAASSLAPDGRPWLEFLMRPVRAGTSKDSTVVEFELTVGNTGTATARDVRISTFMFAAGPAGESEMERMLIDPPADSALAGVEIAAGDATRVDASMSMPREMVAEGTVLPVVVADARYRLPDGSEGRTRASFEVGIPSETGLDPFPNDRTSGLLESVDARLHDEPERV